MQRQLQESGISKYSITEASEVENQGVKSLDGDRTQKLSLTANAISCNQVLQDKITTRTISHKNKFHYIPEERKLAR